MQSQTETEYERMERLRNKAFNARYFRLQQRLKKAESYNAAVAAKEQARKDEYNRRHGK